MSTDADLQAIPAHATTYFSPGDLTLWATTGVYSILVNMPWVQICSLLLLPAGRIMASYANAKKIAARSVAEEVAKRDAAIAEQVRLAREVERLKAKLSDAIEDKATSDTLAEAAKVKLRRYEPKSSDGEGEPRGAE